MLLQKALDKNFWKMVRNDPAYKDIIQYVVDMYNDNKYDEIPTLPFYSRARFYAPDDGDRSEFETPYFRRRRYLASTAMLTLLYPEESRYLHELQEIIWAICDEYSWVLPAHCDGTLESDLNHIDLFSAETGFTLAEICHLLSDRLDKRVRLRAEYEIRNRVIRVYDEKDFFWDTVASNWAAVCAGHVGGILMYMEPELLQKHLPRLLKTMDCFLSSFAADGTCMEGFSYWKYGYGSFVHFADLLYQFTDGETDILQGEKILRISDYMQRSFLISGSTISFADGTTAGKANLPLQHFLHKKFPDRVHLLPKDLMTSTAINVPWRELLRNFLHYDPTVSLPKELENATYVLPDAQQVIHRGKHYSLAVKAGHNQEPHNHNDVGNFIFATEQGQILCDYGAGRYTRQYFGPERYQHFVTSSFGHNVPIVGGHPQKDGEQYAGTLTHEGNRITMQMAGAYDLPGCRRITREITYTEKAVTLQDSFDTTLPITERFVTMIQPLIFSDRIQIADTTMAFDPALATVSCHQEEVEPHGKAFTATKQTDTLYCIDFALQPGVTSISFEITAP